MENASPSSQIEVTIEDAIRMGFEYHRIGEFAMAESIYRQILQFNPVQVDCLHLLGLIAHKAFHHVDAERYIQQAVSLQPGAAEMHNNLGEVERALGKLDASIKSYRRAISLKKNYVDAFENLKKALADEKQLKNAYAAFKGHYKKNVSKHHLLLEMGNQLMMNGNYQVALQAYQKSLVEHPIFQDARFGAANALAALDKKEDAIAYYNGALEMPPAPHERIWGNLGDTYSKMGNLEKAIECYDNALNVNKNYDEIYVRKSIAYIALMELTKADDCLNRALTSTTLNRDALRLIKTLKLPAIMPSSEEINDIRQKITNELDQMLDSEITLSDPFHQINSTNFYLAFHGLDDKPIQKKIANVYEKACPELLYTAPHCKEYRFEQKDRIRIGFISKFIYRHSVARCFGKIIELISQCDGFDVTLLSIFDKEDEVTKRTYQHCRGGRVILPGHVEAARATIAELKLDVLIYLDIGMEPLSYFLAFSRLAPVQCVMNGHPDTTGIGNIDYYLSMGAFEPDDADSHYSEKLVRMRRETIFERSSLPPILRTREELGLPSGRRLYVCPVKLQKIHPDFDVAVDEILKRDALADVIFFSDSVFPVWEKRLSQRFDKSISAGVRNRVKFLPWINNTPDFINVAACSDVLLDSFHFGANSTSVVLYSTGVPLVTLPGKYYRGRNAMGYSKLMGVDELIAEDVDDYVNRAITFASNTESRILTGKKILANNHVLYEDPTAAHELERFIRGLFGN